MLKIGQHVIFADPQREEHDALITTVWNDDLVNVVYVSSDPAREDSYGRQTMRESSVSRYSESCCFGRTFRDPASVKPDYKVFVPQAV